MFYLTSMSTCICKGFRIRKTKAIEQSVVVTTMEYGNYTFTV